MRVLITGDRQWKDAVKIRRVLEALKLVDQHAIIVEGDAWGADKTAGAIALELGFRVEAWPAEWNRHGKSAGPIRNQFMLDESKRRAAFDGHQLEHAVAFHADLAHSKGTKDMVERLDKAGIPVLKIV